MGRVYRQPTRKKTMLGLQARLVRAQSQPERSSSLLPPTEGSPRPCWSGRWAEGEERIAFAAAGVLDSLKLPVRDPRRYAELHRVESPPPWRYVFGSQRCCLDQSRVAHGGMETEGGEEVECVVDGPRTKQAQLSTRARMQVVSRSREGVRE